MDKVMMDIISVADIGYKDGRYFYEDKVKRIYIGMKCEYDINANISIFEKSQIILERFNYAIKNKGNK